MNARRRERLFLAALVLAGGLTVIGLVVAIAFPKFRAVQAARNAPAHPTADSLHNLAIALLNYHDEYNAFPPAIIKDGKGNPLYSGRVLLLPFLNEQALFDQFNKDEPWDSPQNLPISQMVVKAFQNPVEANPRPEQTGFLFVMGRRTVFEPGKTVAMGSLVDGAQNTMLLVEVKASGVNWAEPNDLDVGQPISLPPGNDGRGNFVSFADGSVRLVPNTLTPQQIRALATRDGREPAIAY
jgi:hypothetical protein